MGHIHPEVIGVGKDRDAAEKDACDGYRLEYGYSHDICSVESARLVEKVPPTKQTKTTHHFFNVFHGGHMTQDYIDSVPDFDAPIEQWLEKWAFVLDVHI